MECHLFANLQNSISSKSTLADCEDSYKLFYTSAEYSEIEEINER